MAGVGRPPRLLAAALAAAGRGWPVFPLWPGSKRPAIAGWPDAASCDADTLATWWAAAPYNIGIACGPAGLLVVDLDLRPSTGDTFVMDMAASTYTVATPSGEHRYFAVTPDRPGRCTVGVLAERVDTRAVGGFVVAAGSVRRLHGRTAVYRVVSAPGVAPAPAPAHLLDALAPRTTGSSQHRPSRPVPTAARLNGYVRAALAGELALVRDAAPGTRNTALFTAAVHLGELAGAELLDETHIEQLLLDASAVHVGIDGFTAAEADRAIANGLRYGRQRPRTGQDRGAPERRLRG